MSGCRVPHIPIMYFDSLEESVEYLGIDREKIDAEEHKWSNYVNGAFL
jgi:hypothetical protein